MASLICAISSEVPESPVVSPASGVMPFLSSPIPSLYNVEHQPCGKIEVFLGGGRSIFYVFFLVQF